MQSSFFCQQITIFIYRKLKAYCIAHTSFWYIDQFLVTFSTVYNSNSDPFCLWWLLHSLIFSNQWHSITLVTWSGSRWILGSLETRKPVHSMEALIHKLHLGMILSSVMFLGGKRKLENPQETHVGMERACETPHRPGLNIKIVILDSSTLPTAKFVDFVLIGIEDRGAIVWVLAW